MARRGVMDPDRLPAWAGTPLVVCVGGPKDGQWFFLSDWEEMVRAAERMAPHEATEPPVLAYSLTGEQRTHPAWPSMLGQVAQF